MRKRIQILTVAGIMSVLAVAAPYESVDAAQTEKTTSTTSTQQLPAKGTILREASTKNSYTVLSKGKTVAFQRAGNQKVNIAAVPDKVKFGNTTYKVTAVLDHAFRNNKNLRSVSIGKNITRIGKESFGGCKRLSKVVIHSSKMKKIGTDAISGIKENATIDVPNKKKSAYIKLFQKNTGYKSTMKIK